MEQAYDMKMESGSYRDELENESKQVDPNSHASRLIKQELDRLSKGEDEVPASKKSSNHLVEIHEERPRRVQIRVRIPIKEYPKYNFVGKLLGPKGNTLKALQDELGCKIAIMGRGSMRDKDKEEELRKQGGKYSHLDDDLHVLLEQYGETCESYHRLADAAQELKKFLIPMDEMYEESGMNGSGMRGGRGGFRGGPPMERGGRGGFRGRGSGPPPMSARGGLGAAPSARGRGAPRGAPPSRGGSRGGASAGSYDGYGAQGYSSSYESGYDSYGGHNYSGGDSGYYDYSSNQGSGYDSYSGYDYGGDNWSSGGGKAAAPSSRGASRGQSRPHPYPRS